MRSQEELIKRAKSRQKLDYFGWEWMEYLRAMSAKSAESLKGDLLKEDADLSDWEADLNTDEKIRNCMIDYMPFAWEKANNFRGLSSGRSMAHYRAWLWMAGEDWFDAKSDDYEFYGKPQLVQICEFLGLDSSQWDDGVRLNEEP